METKNNKGFSLIEVLVTMGLIGVLTAIAIPAYKNYRRNANDTVLKADAGNGYKAYHAYNAVNGVFCATLEAVGLSGLISSSTYKSNAFVGFATASTGGCSLSTGFQHAPGTNPFTTISDCTLEDNTFNFGVANTFEGTKSGFFVSNDNGSPKSGSGTCTSSSTGSPNCTNKDDCEDQNNTCHDWQSGDAKAAGSWADSTTLCN